MLILKYLRATFAVAIALCSTHALAIVSTIGQEPRTAAATTLVVDGDVENVFQSGNESLVQILVQTSVAPRLSATGAARYPAPGEFVYAHINSLRDRQAASASSAEIPKPQTRIRAFLVIGSSGSWVADGQEWYQENPTPFDERLADRSQLDRGASNLGVSTERIALGRETALKVLSVTPDSPAANAGIELGDILMEANRIPLQNETQLANAYRNSDGKFSLTVRNVRSGRDVLVDVTTNARRVEGTRNSGRNIKAEPLGVTMELAFYKGEAVVKVTKVNPGSPAARAGITEGILILKANGKSVANPDELNDAERVSRGELELNVVDPSNRQEKSVKVAL
ncbi:MAG: PDZ domain-containing protein [Aureliella sp.]